MFTHSYTSKGICNRGYVTDYSAAYPRDAECLGPRLGR